MPLKALFQKVVSFLKYKDSDIEIECKERDRKFKDLGLRCGYTKIFSLAVDHGSIDENGRLKLVFYAWIDGEWRKCVVPNEG